MPGGFQLAVSHTAPRGELLTSPFYGEGTTEPAGSLVRRERQ